MQEGLDRHHALLERSLRRRGWHAWAAAFEHVAIAVVLAFVTGSVVCGAWLMARPTA